MSEEKIGYCIDCDEDVVFVEKEELQHCVVKGLEFSYMAIHPYCPKCGNLLFDFGLEKINQINRFDAYKKLKGLLTTKDIKRIRKKYNLSQTQLAKAIKIGEKNIARYETGAIQDESIDLLIRLLDSNPELFGIVSIEKKTKKQPKLKYRTI